MNVHTTIITVSALLLVAKLWTDVTELWYFKLRTDGCVRLVRELSEMMDRFERYRLDEKNPRMNNNGATV